MNYNRRYLQEIIEGQRGGNIAGVAIGKDHNIALVHRQADRKLNNPVEEVIIMRVHNEILLL